MTLRSKLILIREGAWVAGGQIAAALASVISIRILSEMLPPDEYGRLTLLVAAVALALGLTTTPFMQAVFRFYPELQKRQQLPMLRHVTRGVVRARLGWVVLLCAAVGVIHGILTGVAVWSWGWLAALLVIDAVRSFELAYLNAARRQNVGAFILAGDAWLRPMAAILVISLAGPTAESALAGYALGAGVAVLIMKFLLRSAHEAEAMGVMTGQSDSACKALTADMRRYSWPLMPLAIFGWLSGMGDRYVVAGVLTMADVGMYAAVYGLASRPFLMASGIIEQTYRPVLQDSIASGNRTSILMLKQRVLVVTIMVAASGFLCFLAMSHLVAKLLLAEEYRSAASLMPWVALGYAFLMVSGFYSRICYAYDATRSILRLTVASSLVGLIFLVPLAAKFGLVGAVVAVPVRFAVELAMSWWMSRRAEKAFSSQSSDVRHAT